MGETEPPRASVVIVAVFVWMLGANFLPKFSPSLSPLSFPSLYLSSYLRLMLIPISVTLGPSSPSLPVAFSSSSSAASPFLSLSLFSFSSSLLSRGLRILPPPFISRIGVTKGVLGLSWWGSRLTDSNCIATESEAEIMIHLTCVAGGPLAHFKNRKTPRSAACTCRRARVHASVCVCTRAKIALHRVRADAKSHTKE